MMKLSKYTSLLIFVAIIILFAFVIFNFTANKEDKLLKNFKITKGFIKKVVDLKGSPFLLSYSYEVQNKIRFNRDPLSVDNTSKEYLEHVFVSRHMIIVYDSLNNSNSRLLLSVRDYNRFRLKPDSATLKIFKMIDSLRIGYDANK